MDTTELILKLGLIGWVGGIEDPKSLFDWLFKKYGIKIKETPLPNTYLLFFENSILCQYFGIKLDDKSVERILPDILKLWKCEDGNLIGPNIDYYIEPNTDWT